MRSTIHEEAHRDPHPLPLPTRGRGIGGIKAKQFVFAVIFAASLAGPSYAETAKPDDGIDPSIGKVEVTLDLPRDKPYVGEMIMLRMRSFVRADVVLDEIRQPPLVDFDTQQLGRDKPIDAMVDGYRVAGFERDLAIFPQQAGRLIIEPFVRHVTIQRSDNSRVQADFASKRIFVDVQNHQGIGAPGAWWLPAKSLTLTDTWSTPPDEIKPGTLSRRVVTVEAVGLTADRLPPPPVVSAPGTIVFKGPAERTTLVTEDGPIARATYQWNIRPISPSPAKLAAIHIPWFDTGERRMRDAAIPDVWVAYVGTLVHVAHERVKTWAETYLAPGPLVAGAAGFAWTLGVGAFLVTAHRRAKDPTRRRLLRRLRRAARFEDASGFRAALFDLARHDPKRWAALAATPLAARIAQVERATYASGDATTPPLAPLAADIAQAMQAQDAEAAVRMRDLPPLDAPLQANPRGRSWPWPARHAT